MNQLNRKEEMIHKLTKRTMQGGDDWCMDIDKWDWNPGVGLYGIVCAYEKIKKYEYLSFLTEWVEKNWRLKEENHTINSTAPFITVAELFRITGEQKYLDSCIEEADRILAEAPLTAFGGLEHTVTEKVDRFEEQMWADTLFMACIFIAKLFNITGDIKYKNFVVKQLKIHHRMLRNSNTGLYYHGYNGKTKDHMSAAYWARANAWIILSSYVIIHEIGSFGGDDEIYSYIKQQAQALRTNINEDGGFNTVLCESDCRNYPEASATAGIAAALKLWNDNGLIGNEFKNVMRKAEEKVLSQINQDGELCNVSCGTPVMETIQAYYRIPKAPTLYGQGLALMMLCL